MTQHDETGARLRAQFAAEGGVPVVFSAKVAHYVASRPDYPSTLFDRLSACGVLPDRASVADIGAGTGLFTLGLLQHGHSVVAVEPSADMRAACDARLGHHPGYRSVAGTAEASGLPDRSVDLVTAAQAFHWFDIPAARRECLRILRPEGRVALVWNDRVLSDPLHQALDQVFAAYGGAKLGALLAHEQRGSVPEFLQGPPEHVIELPHAHRLSREGLASLVFSRSYMPAPESEAGQAARGEVDAVFERHAEGEAVVVRYLTVALVGRPRG